MSCEELAIGPLQLSDHLGSFQGGVSSVRSELSPVNDDDDGDLLVLKPPHWNANCTLGHLKGSKLI